MPVDFSIQRLLVERHIRLQTRLGKDIANAIPTAVPSFRELQIHRLFCDRYPQWKIRKPPTAGYNCAGHVWASRRTAIYEHSEYMKVFADDGYRRTRTPKEDDLTVYVDEQGQIAHVARIISLRPGVAATSDPIPVVVSKLNDMQGEFVHMFNSHPFGDVTIEFWTDCEKGSDR